MQDIKIVDDLNQEAVHEERDINTNPDSSDGSTGEMARVATAQVLGIKADDMAENKAKMDTIVKWAKAQTEDHSLTNLKWVIKNLEMKLGTPNFGETRVTKVARYAYLDMEGKRIEKEKELLYGT